MKQKIHPDLSYEKTLRDHRAEVDQLTREPNYSRRRFLGLLGAATIAVVVNKRRDVIGTVSTAGRLVGDLLGNDPGKEVTTPQEVMEHISDDGKLERISGTLAGKGPLNIRRTPFIREDTVFAEDNFSSNVLRRIKEGEAVQVDGAWVQTFNNGANESRWLVFDVASGNDEQAVGYVLISDETMQQLDVIKNGVVTSGLPTETFLLDNTHKQVQSQSLLSMDGQQFSLPKARFTESD